MTAFRDITAALAEFGARCAERADRLRQIESLRLDGMTQALWPKVQAGDVKAIRALVAVMDRRAKLLGLDVKPTTSINDGPPVNVTVVHQLIEEPGS